MAMANDTLGKTLLRGLITALESKGSISIEDVGNIFQEVAVSVNAGDPRIDAFVRSEVTKLANYIADAKAEILSITPESGDINPSASEFFHSSGLELNAVVSATEDATNKIMDATDNILKILPAVKDANAVAIINTEAIKIYDACSFQDITGQRINKVIKTMDYVEAKVAKLAKLFGSVDANISSLAAKNSAEILKDNRPDAHLMEGPQLAGKGISQDDIDAMFD
jgi:chemotaxis protein CheZ